MDNQNPMISVSGLSVTFKNQQILKQINVDFYVGNIYGIIGRNGSGKTVLLKCICGLLEPSGGTVYVNNKKIGKDIDFPERTGFIIETPGFLMNYSGFKNLRYLASIRGSVSCKDIEDYMTLVGLDPAEKKQVRKYSMGMRQRLGIAQAIMEDPDILTLKH